MRELPEGAGRPSPGTHAPPDTEERPSDGAAELLIPAAATGRARVARLGLAVALLAVVLLLADGAGRPAAGEAPAGETESFVTSVDPPTAPIAIRVLGGDETLRMDAQPGHEVVVLGYSGEPYLRVDPSGAVYENERSPAVAANADRYNRAGTDGAGAPDAEPEWVLVGTGASFEWHDHRMHWMAQGVPVPGGPGDVVFPWTIALRVDGQPVTVAGELRRGPASASWPWFVPALAVAASVVAVGLRRRAAVALAVAAAVAVTALAVALTAGERIALECWTCGGAFDLAPVAVAVVAVAALAVVRTTGRRLAAAAVALVALCGWLLVHVRVLTNPVVVSAWAAPAVRAAVAVALGLSVAGLVLAALEGRRMLDAYASRPPAQRRGARRATTSS